MSTRDELAEAIANCPTPAFHETHYYCPSCPWTASDAPKSAEYQRGYNDAVAQLGRADIIEAAERPDRYL